MDWLMQTFAERSPAWLLLSTLVALLSGFLSSWLTYRCVKRREIIDSVIADIKKQRDLAALAQEREKQERIRREIIRWANPILAAVESLEGRLRNILDRNGYVALSQQYQETVNPNWAISYDYFMNSTLFLFGQYFAWVQMLQEELNFELFESQQEKDTFFKAIAEVSRALGTFPPKYACSGKDTQVFRLQQRAIGELMIVRESNSRRSLGYPEFLQKLTEAQFDQNLKPLKTLLDGLKPEEECRWKRMATTRIALVELKENCEKLLALQATP